jgi:hypothetical protein
VVNQGLQHPWGDLKPKPPEDTMPVDSDQHRDMNIASSVPQFMYKVWLFTNTGVPN